MPRPPPARHRRTENSPEAFDSLLDAMRRLTAAGVLSDILRIANTLRGRGEPHTARRAVG